MYVGEIQIDIGNTIREDKCSPNREIYMLLEQGTSIMEKMRYKYIRVGRSQKGEEQDTSVVPPQTTNID